MMGMMELCLGTWECLQPWHSTSDKESSTTADNNIDTDDEEVDNNPNLEFSTSSELGTSHGLSFAPSEYVETKLLKLMDDAPTPHFIYQDVLNWAMEAKQLQYNFRLQW
jgi:hypothetical protein